VKELGEDDQASLLAELRSAMANETIQNPSKWVYAKARSILSRNAGAGKPGPMRDTKRMMGLNRYNPLR